MVGLSRALVLTGIAVVTLGVLGLILLSPLALTAYSHAGGVDWTRLSLIGQTYGPISALIGGVALIGVGLSLALQTREARESRLQDQRSRHADLLRDAINDPELAACWGPIGLPEDDYSSVKRHLYTNQILSTWQTSYKIGVISEGQLMRSAAVLFSGPVGRAFWERTHTHRAGQARDEDAAAMRFHEILETAYRNAPAPSIPERTAQEHSSNAASRGPTAVVSAAGLAGMLLIVTLTIKKARRRR